MDVRFVSFRFSVYFRASLAACLLCLSSTAASAKGADEKEERRYVVFFLVDALRPDLCREMLEAGELPNIKEHLYDRGVWVENMTSIFPSVSGPAITSMLTGLFPGSHQIPNFQWVDRKTGDYRCYVGTDILVFERDMREHAQTIFDIIPKKETASFGILMGASAGEDQSMIYTSLNPFYHLAPLVHLGVCDIREFLGIGRGIPSLMTLYEWGVDVRGHRKGALSEPVRKVLRRVDKQVGRIVKAYEKRGLYEHTYFVLASDHGLGPVSQNLWIEDVLHEHGFRRKLISWNLGTSYVPDSLARLDSFWASQESVYSYDAVVGASAGGAAVIDFVKNGGWGSDGKKDNTLWYEQVVYDDLLEYRLGKDRSREIMGDTVNAIEFLKNLGGADFVIVRDNLGSKTTESRVRVFNRAGESLISRKPDDDQKYVYKYEVLQGADPLGYTAGPRTSELMDGGFHAGRIWQRASASLPRPDAVVLLTQVFDTDRSGSVIISCKEGWSVQSKIVEKHGGLTREEMIATFCISGPGFSKSDIHTARIVDITPTILYLLRKEVDVAFDGTVIPEIREQVDAERGI